MKSKEEIINIARSWLGTQWKHNQQNKNVGVDCVNFLHAIAVESGINIPPIPQSYARLPNNNEIKTYLSNNFTLKNKEDINICDILLFTWQGRDSHVALVTEVNPLKIIHANQRLGKVSEHNCDGIWLRRLESVWEF